MEKTTINPRFRWAIEVLRDLGWREVRPPRQAKLHPWSLVGRIDTGDGAVYLKYVRGAFRQEPGLTRHLNALAPALVPRIVAENTDLACWLIADAGPAYSARVEPTQDKPALAALLDDHAALQRETLGQTETLLRLGAKDLRPANYGRYLTEILAAPDDLVQDQVPAETVAALGRAGDALSRLATELRDLAPPETVVHMDLRHTNIKVQDGHCRVIDWGDAGVGPAFLDPVPLFSELAAGSTPPALVARLQDRQLRHWTDLAPEADLRRALDLCRVVFPLLYAHGLIHARPSWDPTLKPSFYGLLRFYLAAFLQRLTDAAT